MRNDGATGMGTLHQSHVVGGACFGTDASVVIEKRLI